MSPKKAPPPEPEPAVEHIHDLEPHCPPPAACPWVRCKAKGCGFFATLDGSKWTYSP